MNLPNGGVDPNTVISSNVYLYQTAFPNNNSKYRPSSVKTTGGGDAMLLSPLANLLPSTSYTFVVTAGVKDMNGDAFTAIHRNIHHRQTSPAVSQNYAFTQVPLPTTAGSRDHRRADRPRRRSVGVDRRWPDSAFPINSDGTLGTPQVITSLQTA